MSITKFTRPFYSVCSKVSAFCVDASVEVRRHLQKPGIDFLIASCYSSSDIIRSAVFGCSLVADSDYYLRNIMTCNTTSLLS